MRVHAYVDGFNLYYGGRSLSQGAIGWKWLDLRGLLASVAVTNWPGARIERLVYCTARVRGDAQAHRDQDVYLRALRATGSVDWIHHGRFYEKVKIRPLAVPNGHRTPTIVRSDLPVMVKDAHGSDVPGACFMVCVADREEKGSDVNLATHLLMDAMSSSADAAIVVSNDSDLGYPVYEARRRIALGVVNPNSRPTAGALRRRPAHGPGGHWETRLTLADRVAHQLPDPCHGHRKPLDW
jgi:uncharacterized LabA/DUF88 family protein